MVEPRAQQPVVLPALPALPLPVLPAPHITGAGAHWSHSLEPRRAAHARLSRSGYTALPYAPWRGPANSIFRVCPLNFPVR